MSAAWRMQATAEPEVLTRWWQERPDAGIILPTGRVFDVFDVPAEVGAAAIGRAGREEVPLGPVAAFGDERYLFFVATRGAPDDEDEWWSCHLDCFPETIGETPGMRWHCRDSYVVAPPTALPGGREVRWLRPPRSAKGSATGPTKGADLPDPVRLLEVLADSL